MPEVLSALPRLGFGAAGVGNLRVPITDDDAWALLAAAWDAGVRHFDTAPHYGLGLSERRLGRFLLTKPRNEFVVSTKVGRLLEPHPEGAGTLDDEGYAVPADVRRRWDFTRDGVRRSLDESLARLGLDRVDVLYVHDPERTGDPRALHSGLSALAELRGEEVVGAIGIGSMDTAALLAAAESGVADVLMAANRYTLLTPDIEGPVLDACAVNQVEVVAAAVFNSGLLAGGSDFDYGQAPPEIVRRLGRLQSVCERYDTPLRVAALQFPLRHPLVRAVVVGGQRPHQVRQNVDDLEAPVPEALWRHLADEGLVTA